MHDDKHDDKHEFDLWIVGAAIVLVVLGLLNLLSTGKTAELFATRSSPLPVSASCMWCPACG